uniref:Uncharacterized protein n=1 Tax=Picea glauca TaxID=3330 RepID=A0A101M452_PICGL|nr:hypothetical protein ABT39_MTgene375 [Picea glauca]QHR86491.1 hypothetical protein Q903MT_gene493 [Picea sitchensis]
MPLVIVGLPNWDRQRMNEWGGLPRLRPFLMRSDFLPGQIKHFVPRPFWVESLNVPRPTMPSCYGFQQNGDGSVS